MTLSKQFSIRSTFNCISTNGLMVQPFVRLGGVETNASKFGAMNIGTAIKTHKTEADF
jgi:hypothetical protein